MCNILISYADILFDGFRAFKQGSPNMNSLVGFGSVAAFIISTVSELFCISMFYDLYLFLEYVYACVVVCK
jgi:cation transport ATPase